MLNRRKAVTRLLCRPCGEALAKGGKYTKVLRTSLGADVKITCEGCGRRRYGYAYECEGR